MMSDTFKMIAELLSIAFEFILVLWFITGSAVFLTILVVHIYNWVVS